MEREDDMPPKTRDDLHSANDFSIYQKGYRLSGPGSNNITNKDYIASIFGIYNGPELDGMGEDDLQELISLMIKTLSDPTEFEQNHHLLSFDLSKTNLSGEAQVASVNFCKNVLKQYGDYSSQEEMIDMLKELQNRSTALSEDAIYAKNNNADIILNGNIVKSSILALNINQSHSKVADFYTPNALQDTMNSLNDKKIFKNSKSFNGILKAYADLNDFMTNKDMNDLSADDRLEHEKKLLSLKNACDKYLDAKDKQHGFEPGKSDEGMPKFKTEGGKERYRQVRDLSNLLGSILPQKENEITNFNELNAEETPNAFQERRMSERQTTHKEAENTKGFENVPR